MSTGKERREKILGKTMKQSFEDICNEYLRIFCERHGLDSPHGWIGGSVGGIVEVGDMFVGLEEMRYDVDFNVPEEKFEDWYWKSIELAEMECPRNLTYEAFCKGAPWPYTEDQLKSFRESRNRIAEAERIRSECIEADKKLKRECDDKHGNR